MKGEHTVRVLCASFEVSRSGYYDWCRAAGPRAAATQEFQAEVMRIHAESDGTYGSPRVTRALRRAGRKVGHNRVARVLRECGLQGRPPAAIGSAPPTARTITRSRPTGCPICRHRPRPIRCG